MSAALEIESEEEEVEAFLRAKEKKAKKARKKREDGNGDDDNDDDDGFYHNYDNSNHGNRRRKALLSLGCVVLISVSLGYVMGFVHNDYITTAQDESIKDEISGTGVTYEIYDSSPASDSASEAVSDSESESESASSSSSNSSSKTYANTNSNANTNGPILSISFSVDPRFQTGRDASKGDENAQAQETMELHFAAKSKNGDGGGGGAVKNPVKKNRPKPWESTPPSPIDLILDGSDDANANDDIPQFIKQRHVCIHNIRMRHERLLRSHFFFPSDDDDDDDNNNNNNNGYTDYAMEQMLLVDPAYHGNVGDHMLTLGEMVFLQRQQAKPSKKTTEAAETGKSSNNNNYSNNFRRSAMTIHTVEPLMSNNTLFKQCNYNQAAGYYRPCKYVIENTKEQYHAGALNHRVAVWHAGGNWGDLWRNVQSKRVDSFGPILQYRTYQRVISMPQSLYYGQGEKHIASDTTKIKSSIEKGLGIDDGKNSLSLKPGTRGEHIAQQRVIFTWREKESYDFAQVHYPFATNLLVPDIAFQLGPFHPIRYRQDKEVMVDIVLFLRGDKESKLSQLRNRETIQGMLDNLPQNKNNNTSTNSLTFRIVDWKDRLSIFSKRDKGYTKPNDIYFTETSIRLLSLGKVVICDRLHASILSYLSGVPFIYIDQVSQKITRTLSVALNGTAVIPSHDNNSDNDGPSVTTTTTTAPSVEDCWNPNMGAWDKATSLPNALYKARQMIHQLYY